MLIPFERVIGYLLAYNDEHPSSDQNQLLVHGAAHLIEQYPVSQEDAHTMIAQASSKIESSTRACHDRSQPHH